MTHSCCHPHTSHWALRCPGPLTPGARQGCFSGGLLGHTDVPPFMALPGSPARHGCTLAQTVGQQTQGTQRCPLLTPVKLALPSARVDPKPLLPSFLRVFHGDFPELTDSPQVYQDKGVNAAPTRLACLSARGAPWFRTGSHVRPKPPSPLATVHSDGSCQACGHLEHPSFQTNLAFPSEFLRPGVCPVLSWRAA